MNIQTQATADSQNVVNALKQSLTDPTLSNFAISNIGVQDNNIVLLSIPLIQYYLNKIEHTPTLRIDQPSILNIINSTVNDFLSLYSLPILK